jgi:hypothetical protein
MWKHDKFDELADSEKPERRRTSGGRGGRGEGRGEGSRNRSRKERGPLGDGDGDGGGRGGGKGGRGSGRSDRGSRGAASANSTDTSGMRISPGGRQQPLTPQPVTPLKASAPEFKPSLTSISPHPVASPSPTAGAMLASATPSTAQVTAQVSAPVADSTGGNGSGGASQIAAQTTTATATGASMVATPTPTKPYNTGAGAVYSAEDVSVMKNIPNRRTFGQHTPPPPPPHHHYQQHQHHQQSLPHAYTPPQSGMGMTPLSAYSAPVGGTWYPDGGMHSNLHGAPVYYPPDPWVGGTGAGAGAGMYRVASPHGHQQYPAPPPAHMVPQMISPHQQQYGHQHHQQHQHQHQQSMNGQQLPYVQGQLGGLRGLHRDAPEFTPYSQSSTFAAYGQGN